MIKKSTIPHMSELTNNIFTLYNKRKIQILYTKKEVIEIRDRWFIYYVIDGVIECMEWKDLKKLIKRGMIL